MPSFGLKSKSSPRVIPKKRGNPKGKCSGWHVHTASSHAQTSSPITSCWVQNNDFLYPRPSQAAVAKQSTFWHPMLPSGAAHTSSDVCRCRFNSDRPSFLGTQVWGSHTPFETPFISQYVLLVLLYQSIQTHYKTLIPPQPHFLAWLLPMPVIPLPGSAPNTLLSSSGNRLDSPVWVHITALGFKVNILFSPHTYQ